MFLASNQRKIFQFGYFMDITTFVAAIAFFCGLFLGRSLGRSAGFNEGKKEGCEIGFKAGVEKVAQAFSQSRLSPEELNHQAIVDELVSRENFN